MITPPKLSISNRLRDTPFTQRVQEQGAKAFTVYNHMLLPTEFATLEQDYWHLCEHVQVWDVGAERQVSIAGNDAEKLVQWMTPRDIRKVEIGRCVYAPLADENGRLINDPIALKLDDKHWWLSVADSDVLLWAKGLAVGAGLDVQVHEPDVWPLAVQGPKADELMCRVFGDVVMDIRFFRFASVPYGDHDFRIARSGWSKQGGYEIYVDNAEQGVKLYDALFAAGSDLSVRPGCPNLIERIEGGLLSFGNDMTLEHTVLECGLDRFFSLDNNADSLSGPALRRQRDEGVSRLLRGLAIPANDALQVLQTVGSEHFLVDANDRLIGRLGSQVWSPRYHLQLATVMLEQPDSHGPTIDLRLMNGSIATAHIMDVPFDFSLPAINPQPS